MANTNPEPPSLEDIRYVLNHVFLPPKLPQDDDYDANHDVALCRLAYKASLEFDKFLSQSQERKWSTVKKMLKNLLESTRLFDNDVFVTNISDLKDGGVLAFHIRAQNAALILRRMPETMVFEVFEVSPPPDAVMAIEGKLVCSYPGPAVELPLNVAQDPSFVKQLVSFLVHMDVDRLPDAEATTTKAGSKVPETRGTTHPRYISQLLIMILRGMGNEARVDRITKRIADEVCWDNARNPWRRSSLWLVLRVAIQTTADFRETYKTFLVFFQVQLLQLFVDHNFSSELLHAARVKTSRRVHKLGASVSPNLLQKVETVCQEVEKHLRERWSQEQRLQSFSPSYIRDPVAIEKDTTISLLGSRAYLTKIMSSNPYINTPTTFHPSHYPRLQGPRDFHHLYPDGLTKAVQADSRIALADFELLVQERLDRWVEDNKQNESACKTLGSCLSQYITAAQVHYLSNPEDQSLMLLSIMELWVALDKIASVLCPLLLSYSPEIPASVLDPLLLRRAKSIKRATQIGLYLRRRYANATVGTSIYSDQFDCNMFAVRYFQTSPSLQGIRASIEQDATQTRMKKLAELRQANASHVSLQVEIDKLHCECIYRFIRYRCERCRLREKANDIRIEVHEWPLPSHPLVSAAVVFELKCPPAFAIWRTRTYQILRDIGMAHISIESESVPHVLLEDYKGLATWSTKGTSGRITFGSDTKSFLNSHYRSVKIPADEGSVCVNNGLHLRLYDTMKGENAFASFNLKLDSYCTLRLPEDREALYRHLQYGVTHTTHTHNETIANQGDCPVNLNMHEQLAFSNLRCGSRLQWMNIARELRTNNLTFSREEVHTLITQAAWQIGPLSSDDSTRECHFELGVSDFGLTLTREAMDLLSHIDTNWMEGTTVKTIIYLISRLLASTTDTQRQVRMDGYRLLRKARKVVYRWMHEIVHQLQNIVDDDEANELQRRACDMAATCRATLDVEDGTHLNVLLCSPEDVAIAIECAIVIHDNTPPHLGHAYPDFQKLLNRDRRLAHLLESPLIKLIRDDRCGLDIAITSVWSSYRAGDGGWRQLDEPNSRWLTTFTAPLKNQRAQQVHYDILNGKLLVDGKPLGRLPQEIVDHSTYRQIFGQKILDVIPADMPGMDYATRNLVYDYQVFFALHDSSQSLIIRATRSSQTFELIPLNVFLGDFPTLLVKEHAHWMNIHTSKVEFRPLNRLWEQSPHNWHLSFLPDGPSRMIHGTAKLLDIQSESFKGIAARICPLEYSEYLTIVLDVQSHTISIELPRLRLSFFVNTSGELESKNMQGMVIDNDQSTGTMTGLSSQLVLRHQDLAFASLPRSRCVLIPRGSLHFSLSDDQNHVRVRIDTSTGYVRQVTWDKYKIDSDLGMLVGNVNLTSRLYRIYLHALCSHPLPDPLTNQTGTDHALQELKAAGSFSFQRLTKDDVELLRLIGNLTPRRNYYPKHLRVMQTTNWSPHLPAFSQHGMFDTAVREILQYAQSLTVFDGLKESKVDLDYKCNSDSLLMARATRRNAVYYEGAVDIPADCDKRYDSRDSPHIAEYDSDGIEALKISRLVYAWPVGHPRHLEPDELLETFKKWGNMNGPVRGATLVYTQEWLRLEREFPAKWLSIYDLGRLGQLELASKKFELVFSFAALAYSAPSLRKFIPDLLAFATMSLFIQVEPPPYPTYNLRDGFEPLRNQVQSLIASGTNNLSNSPAEGLSRKLNETSADLYSRQSMYYNEYISRKTNNVADRLMTESRSSCPHSPFHQTDCNWFDTKKIMSDVTKYFASCSRNRDLRSFTSQVTTILQENNIVSPLTCEQIPRFLFVPQLDVGPGQLDSPFTLASLLSRRTDSAPTRSTCEIGTGAPNDPRPLDQPIDTSILENLISQFNRKGCFESKITQLYSERLERSRRELHGQQTSILSGHLPLMTICRNYRDQCQRRLDKFFRTICSALAPSTTTERILAEAGLWPRIYHRSLLHPLASTANIPLSLKWTESLTDFAKLFVEYQHSQRLLGYALQSDTEKYFKELDGASFNWREAGWNPDWLLIQIQGNFITRAIQYDVAREMIAPSSSHSTILQLNMGEGKSHVIVPLVAVALADSHKLVRVVVLKPLAGQMFHLLVERISGLANRRVFYLPFSRDVTMNMQQVQHIRNLFEECARVQGVLVTQPEHILSFRLMVVDRMLSSGSPLDHVAQGLRDMQEWLTSTSRDILDESDELLHVRYQLIYTMGQQQPLDGGQDRWTTTQKIFDLVRRHSQELYKEFPKEVELLEHCAAQVYEGKFLHVRLLGTSAAQALVSRIAEDALDGALDNLIFVNINQGSPLRTAVLHFIKEYNVDSQTYLTVKCFYGNSGLWKALLLLRGLLAHGILVHVLSQRRWRVDYGLDLKRSLLAVPYRAKDVPSLRSEFGHPDVAVCLTCLSYYYGGLTTSQVRECFDLLNKLDNPPLEYEKWVKRGGKGVPESLRQLIGVNTKDAQKFTNDIIPIFQHNQAAIDFFLSQVVFPKDAKEFPSKLGTSGWDLVERKAHFTTGFSGTNDNSDLLPTSIAQSDPVNQLRTNAQVLWYLLRPENNRYICTQGAGGQPCSAAEFLELLVREPKEVRVLLDVGAQMLEMANQQLVAHWLSLRKDIVAGVLFDDADNLWVLSQDGVVESFYPSPFSQLLDQCIVYLDDAHTRGTDLKFPLNFRAMVTLGPKVTKDRLVQGCMRMRKLGHGQSVVFCAPPEVDRRIREAQSTDSVKVFDILSWVMSNTCTDIEHHIPHWVQQGVDFHKRQIGDAAPSTSDSHIEFLKNIWLQPAARSLEEMYGLVTERSSNLVNDNPAMHERLRTLGVTAVRDAQMEEEQEREVSHEFEQELQLERPPRVPAALHHLDEGVRHFVQRGTISMKADVFFPLMTPLRSESDMPSPQNPWSTRLLATRDFMNTTINGNEKSILTDYLRPVNWIVSRVPKDDESMILVVMSPYEVNVLLRDIRKSECVRLHMYAPRSTQAMKTFENLDFYCVPPLLPRSTALQSLSLDVRCQLNIWAGQLYLDQYETYLRLCLLLGVSSSEAAERYSSVQSDRFVPKTGRTEEMAEVCLFDESPLTLLKMLFGLRRKGMSYQQTHIGKILHARLLLREDFEE